MVGQFWAENSKCRKQAATREDGKHLDSFVLVDCSVLWFIIKIELLIRCDSRAADDLLHSCDVRAYDSGEFFR